MQQTKKPASNYSAIFRDLNRKKLVTGNFKSSAFGKIRCTNMLNASCRYLFISVQVILGQCRNVISSSKNKPLSSRERGTAQRNLGNLPSSSTIDNGFLVRRTLQKNSVSFSLFRVNTFKIPSLFFHTVTEPFF